MASSSFDRDGYIVLPEMASSSFDRDGYIVLPDAISPRQMRALLRELQTICNQAASDQATDHDSVIPPTDCAAFQWEHDVNGSVVHPLRCHKIQGVGLVSAGVRALVCTPRIVATATALAGSDEQLDAFGTKYFPVMPKSCGSVGWHDDNYYFGTTRSRTISCVCYLADIGRETGCLRVLPGSHLDERVGPERAQHYSLDRQKHGEYISETALDATIDDAPKAARADTKKRKRRQDEVVDVAVKAGTAVLFDANLLHATWPNASSDASSPRVAFHFIPANHQGEFRGVSFARGKFADRHPTVAD